MKKLIYGILFFLLTLTSSGLHSSIAAQEVMFSDDFSGDLSKWRPLRDDGRYWSITDGALQAFIPFGSTVTELVPTESAWQDVKNYVYGFDLLALQGADKNVSFGVTDKNNWYELHFTPSLTEIAKVRNGVVVWSEQYPYILSNAYKHYFSVVFKDGLIATHIDGTKVLETTDPSFQISTGTIAVKASTGGIFPTQIKIDNVIVRKIVDPVEAKDTVLDVNLIKQTDLAWANLEYDTASLWAPSLNAGTTFKDWGCNLVSLLMIMQYHGISTLSDGTNLTPFTLNSWLLAHNGYYHSPNTGNINRKSISQLTAEISQTKGTPKLEFLYVENNLIETAITEIEKNNPVILELDGHFVVADGFTADKKDLYIKDPAYNISKLSDHHLPLKSVRLYTPSQTDLSYLSVVADSEVAVALTSESNESQPLNKYSEKLRAFTNSSTQIFGPTSTVVEIPKLTTGTYILDINNPLSKSTLVTVTTYTSDGSSKELLSKELPSGKKQFKLAYEKDGISSLVPIKSNTISFNKLRSTIEQLTADNQIKHIYLEKVLLQLIQSAEHLQIANQKKVLKVLKLIIENTPQTLITKFAKALLLEQVKLLMVILK